MAAPRRLLTFLPLPRLTLRGQLALLYAGMFLVLGAALLAIANLTLHGQMSAVVSTKRAPATNIPIALAEHHADVHQLAVGSAVALGVGLLLALGLGWFIAGRLLGRLSTITTAAREISASNLHRRLAISGPDDELKELGSTLDGLFERLEASFQSQRHFVANASHELRTPLTAERSLVQVALADPEASVESLRSTCEEVLQLGVQQQRLIDSLLTLANSERGLDRRQLVDVGALAEHAVNAVQRQAGTALAHVEPHLSPASVMGDPSLLESLVSNLLENAVQHNVTGGWARISTHTSEGHTVVSVSNSGPVIAPDDIERLFQPFQRLGHERLQHGTGHGLGLAIVGAIAKAHEGTVTAHARLEGGLDVEVILPSTAQANRA